jgi:hypothetical protein
MPGIPYLQLMRASMHPIHTQRWGPKLEAFLGHRLVAYARGIWPRVSTEPLPR